jgi:ribonuclease HI
MMLQIFTDGGALGNPGPAAVGVVVKKGNKALKKFAKYLGETTNNVAEYSAVIEALQWLKKSSSIINHQSSIIFYLDSKLVVNQLNGLFKIKDYKLRNLAVQVRQLEREIGGNVFYQHIPREKNKEADSLVKKILEKL